MAERDYYEILGVPRDATADQIKKAYRTLARKHHPDVNPGDKKAEARFKEAQAAYDILSDAEKKGLYDRYGRAAFEGMAAAGPRAGATDWAHMAGGPDVHFDFSQFFGPGAPGGFGPGHGAAGPGGATADVGGEEGGSGIFEELLGRMRGGGRRRGAAMGPRPGRNLEATLTIPFLTAARGGETAIDVDRDGRRESLSVKIPAGIESGAKLRLRGQGEKGEKGATDGDLIVHVQVQPHPYFTRDGRNLTVEVPITVAEAVLGARVDVPSLNGLKSLPIPPGTSGGMKLRLRGQGLPGTGGAADGDLFVVLKVVVPKSVDEESQRLIRQFAERNTQSPRDGLWTSA